MNKETKPIGTESETNRGWQYVSFKDEYDHDCSLQISSRAICENEDGTVDDPLGWIWLGLDSIKPRIMKTDAQRLGLKLPPGEVTGWMDYPTPKEVIFHSRMHLNEQQVRGLIARLQIWLETGELHQEP